LDPETGFNTGGGLKEDYRYVGYVGACAISILSPLLTTNDLISFTFLQPVFYVNACDQIADKF
jgi:hypothetical protein